MRWNPPSDVPRHFWKRSCPNSGAGHFRISGLQRSHPDQVALRPMVPRQSISERCGRKACRAARSHSRIISEAVPTADLAFSHGKDQSDSRRFVGNSLEIRHWRSLGEVRRLEVSFWGERGPWRGKRPWRLSVDRQADRCSADRQRAEPDRLYDDFSGTGDQQSVVDVPRRDAGHSRHRRARSGCITLCVPLADVAGHGTGD